MRMVLRVSSLGSKAGGPEYNNDGLFIPVISRGMKHYKPSEYRSEYQAYNNAKQRCLNPNNPCWRHYGGRGITMSEEIQSSFNAFMDCVGVKPSPDLTLDRIDNSKGYERNNLRWATLSEQARNKVYGRRNRKAPRKGAALYDLNGVVDTLDAHCKRIGLPHHTARYRLKHGYSIEEVFLVQSDYRRRD